MLQSKLRPMIETNQISWKPPRCTEIIYLLFPRYLFVFSNCVFSLSRFLIRIRKKSLPPQSEVLLVWHYKSRKRDRFYPLFGAVGPLQLDDGGVEANHPGHPLQETVLTFDPRVVYTVTKNPLVFIHGRALLHRRVVRDCIGAFLVQVGEDEVSHLRVQLPDSRSHHGDGEGRFVVRRHFLLSLFLHSQNINK